MRELLKKLRQQHVDFVQILYYLVKFFAFLIDTVEALEYLPQRPAYRNIVAVLFPIEIASYRSPEIVEISNVIAQLVDDECHFSCLVDRVVGNGGDLLLQLIQALHQRDLLCHQIGLLQQIIIGVFHEPHILLHARALHADQKRHRSVFNRCSFGPGNPLHPRDSRNPEDSLG